MSTRTELIDAFEACTLPREQWTHQAHLLMGFWYLRTLPREEAAERIKGGLLRLIAAWGIVTTLERGYHETITQFYIHMIGRYVEATRQETDWEKLTTGLLQECGPKELPFRYYSKERLNSWEARTRWVEPDLCQLPASSVEPCAAGAP